MTEIWENWLIQLFILKVQIQNAFFSMDSGAKAGLAALILLACAGLFSLAVYLRQDMGDEAVLRKGIIKSALADNFVDMLLELHANGVLTAKEVNDECVKYARARGLWDLMPKKLIQEPPAPEKLKEEIKERTDLWKMATDNFSK